MDYRCTGHEYMADVYSPYGEYGHFIPREFNGENTTLFSHLMLKNNIVRCF